MIDDATQELLIGFAYTCGRYEGTLEATRAILVSYNGELPSLLMKGLADSITAELEACRAQLGPRLEAYARTR